MASWMSSVAAAAAASASAAAAKEKEELEKIGVLKKRPAEIPRAEGGLLKTLASYIDKSLDQSAKKKGHGQEVQHLLSRMKVLTDDVVGQEKDVANDVAEVKPKLLSTFNLRRSEIDKLKELAKKDKVQLHVDKGLPGKRMPALSAELYGDTSLLKLSKLPETGKGGLIGDLVRMHAESARSLPRSLPAWIMVRSCSVTFSLLCVGMRCWTVSTWVREETQPCKPADDIIIDRLTFGAKVLPKIAYLRDKYIGLAGELGKLRSDVERAYDKEMALQAVRSSHNAQPPPPKRGPAAASASSSGPAAPLRRIRYVKAWDKEKQEARQATRAPADKKTYVSVSLDEVVTVIDEIDDEWLWVEKADGSIGRAPAILSAGGPRFTEVPADTSSALVLSSDEGGSEAEKAQAASEDWPASPYDHCGEAVDVDMTPGRAGAPIYINHSACGDSATGWTRHEHLSWCRLVDGAHEGKVLWWDGEFTETSYQLADDDGEFHVVRIIRGR